MSGSRFLGGCLIAILIAWLVLFVIGSLFMGDRWEVTP